jgi:hypothetical protein
MNRIVVLTSGLVLLLGLTAGSALAHHDGGANLPPNNPHSVGIPQFVWDEGAELLMILGEDGMPTEVFAVLGNDPDLDFAQGNFWLVGRIGGEGGDYFKLRLEGFVSTGEFEVIDPDEPDIAFVNPLDPEEEPVVEGTEPGNYTYVLVYPHEHYVVLHAGTPQERCIDLANERVLNNPNQHNAVHIGAPGHETDAGFANAGHEIHAGTCAGAGF